ncbi:hypothetical protein MARGE09_P2575 [Marinagarivorans cellulosilyticus]|uniref:Uncharacterized protein n=1 Tax=Marinagarivorans cellulosilyticus TaxID=2721545 RepID=A0AAN2BKT9_9GAMM|nr:hypothetical protein MARGE09_P2575 [Marinagarivorans cellulosilyticus]
MRASDELESPKAKEVLQDVVAAAKCLVATQTYRVWVRFPTPAALASSQWGTRCLVNYNAMCSKVGLRICGVLCGTTPLYSHQPRSCWLKTPPFTRAWHLPKSALLLWHQVKRGATIHLMARPVYFLFILFCGCS